ncbi:hypothetical protein R6Y95_03135 [Methanoculleus palmolei]|uniref:Uncharacterized protein n=1 Tax=Methanoculleus palmolei TaxID=72612 RepID=A0ABD8A9Z6_9EURY|nr:hypothetical protein R6Y95_03135 [Methanoculleus palmolei]
MSSLYYFCLINYSPGSVGTIATDGGLPVGRGAPGTNARFCKDRPRR